MIVIPYKGYPELINSHWGDLAYWAYDQYINRGRGAIYIQKETPGGDENTRENFRYVTYDGEARHLDPGISKIIGEYRPGSEVIIQYIQENAGIRTVRVRAADPGRRPEVVWFTRLTSGI